MPRATIIEPQNEGEAPLSYQLSPGQTIETLAVAADFDGSGAAGDFLPTLSMYAQDGRRLGTFSAQTTVVAGNSEQVTFFPFAPPASSGGAIAEITSGDGSIVVTNPTGPMVDVQRFKPLSEGITGLFNAPAGTAGLLTLTHAAGSLLLDYTDPQNPTIKEPGYYAAFMIGTGGGAYAAGVQFEMALSFINSPDPLAIGGDATTVGDGASQCLISLNTATARMNMLSALNVFGFNHDAVAQPIGCSVVVQKIWPV